MSAGNVVISVRDLGKSYQIVHNANRHVTLAEAMLDRLRHPLRRQKVERFQALTDVSFDINQGDVVGIIGRNGAGKSTLLKILSRITDPTSGAIDLHGRVGSLLEVGTGFHPELTGHENIYLNGHILGMRKKEIDSQFDAIVDFAGVEKFLDTPVKRYSSGMYVRLAFAVAAHLSSEILVVDEVLAVGDTEFQKKCLGKMKDVATGGRTVLLVSHNLASVTNLCNHTLVLDRGKLLFDGATDEAVAFYASSMAGGQSRVDLSTFRPSWARPVMSAARLTDAHGNPCASFPMGADIRVEVDFAAPPESPLRSPVLGVVLNHSTNGILGGVNSRMTASEVESGRYRGGTLGCLMKRPPLLQGNYTIDLWLGDGPSDVDCLLGYLQLEVQATDIYRTGRTPFHHLGSIFLEPEFTFVSGGSDNGRHASLGRPSR
ncbi:MAG TPA: ABC transporter ATP-binding protein [Tepidisphaeraceae bacterium]|jgi:lipopolysaccharide transport system ATP-binding protein|nr:ABC transporter ATP-binding protein [Tepidisphaeraceae bacterium]